MSDARLPMVAKTGLVSPSEKEREGESAADSDARGGSPGDGSGDPGRTVRILATGGLVMAGLVVVLGVASLVGEPVRNAVFVETDVSPVGSELSWSDAPAEAARFFSDRDSVRVRVPWDMSVSEFLSLYHLETNPSAREALRDQLGASAPEDPLREGDEVTFTLTQPRPGR